MPTVPGPFIVEPGEPYFIPPPGVPAQPPPSPPSAPAPDPLGGGDVLVPPNAPPSTHPPPGVTPIPAPPSVPVPAPVPALPPGDPANDAEDIGDDQEAGDEPTPEELLEWEQNAEAYEQGEPLLFAVEASPGELIGFPYAGSHSKQLNCTPPPGPSCNWQSMNAVDVWLWPGTVITAVEDGVISPGSWGYGESASGGRFAGFRCHLITADGKAFFYTHMIGNDVAKGTRVKKGDRIGRSGIANGVPHLHFAARPPYDPRAFYRDAFNLHERNPIVPNPSAPPPPPGDPFDLSPGANSIKGAIKDLISVIWDDWHGAATLISEATDSIDRTLIGG